MSRYDDIINLPHHVSSSHPQMSLQARAAQFSPFAALTGHTDAIQETARLTQEQAVLDETVLEELNRKLAVLKSQLSDKPAVKITYFSEDAKKSGGQYKALDAVVRKIDENRHILVLEDGLTVRMHDIYDISF